MMKCDTSDSVYRNALYVGSFPVEGADHQLRTGKIHKELESLRNFTRSKRVLVCVSVSGIKICSVDRENIFMAHALRRVSYATCDAANRQVVFLAREPLGEASLQYCHVFVTESSSLAEELNRIIGDAFQIAFIKQRITNMALNGEGNDHPPIPRLSDWHEPWLDSNNSALMGFLELPPPPSYPPPPLSDVDILRGATEGSSNERHGVPVDNGLSKPDNANQETISCVSDNNAVLKGADDLDVRSNVPTSSAFRRRHFFRLSEGTKRFSGIADAQIAGGSTRQPKRRENRGVANFLASARHSSFFPNTTTNKDPAEPGLLELLSAQNSPPKPNIFLDLRTFAGGSPVVALKERLDAQAVADAKASAFAEAAAVLAAAKHATVTTKGPESNVNKSSRLNPNPSAYPAVSSTSPCSTTSTHSEPNRPAYDSDNSFESPPTPPIRIHSLKRVPARRSVPHSHATASIDNSQNHRLSDHALKNGTGQLFAIPSSATCDNHPRTFSNSPHISQTHRTSAAQIDTDSRLQSSYKPTAWNPSSCTLDHKAVHRPRRGFEQIRIEDKRMSKAHGSSSIHQSPHNQQIVSSRTPLHVTTIADSAFAVATSHGSTVSSWSQIQPATQSVMSTSTISTETPTPTATPTPTPMQNPHSINEPISTVHAPVVVSSEDMEFLKHAPWYQAMVPREIAFELLAREELGSFLVRNSVSHPDCCALSVRVPIQENPTGITHYLIQRTIHGVKLKGLEKEWPSLRALITHLTVIPEMLPCPLRLPAHNVNPMFTNVDEHIGSNRFNNGACSSDKRSHQVVSQPADSFLNSLSSVQHPEVNGGGTLRTSNRGKKEQISTYREKQPMFNGPVVEDEDEDYQRLSDFSSILADLPPITDEGIPTC